MNCAKCNRNIANAKEAVKCVECQSQYHVNCCRIRTLAKLNAMSSQSVAAWKCDGCSQETTSTNSKSDTEDYKVTELLTSMKKYMETHFATVENQLATLQTSHEDFKCRLSALESENVELISECKVLREANEELNGRVNVLEHDLAELQQYTRSNNVEIRGIPLTKNEDIYQVLRVTAKALGIEFNRDSISIAHRLPVPEGKRFHPNIVVQFISRTIRAAWITASKQKRIKTTDLAATLPPGSIFIVDHLTPHNKALLGRAKSLIKREFLAYAWSRDGKIFVRKTPHSEALRVRSHHELDCIADAPTVRGGGGSGANKGGDGNSERGGGDGIRATSPKKTTEG